VVTGLSSGGDVVNCLVIGGSGVVDMTFCFSTGKGSGV